MTTQNGPDVDVFLRSVESRFQNFKTCLSQLLHLLVTGADNEKVAKAKETLDIATTLQSVLSRQDQPQWLEPVISSLRPYIQTNGSPGFATGLVTTIASNYQPTVNHQWAFEHSDGEGFDFDGVFRRCEAESKIPELFDRLVEILDKIVQCEDLDSRKVIHTLETIIATLKANRNGSYFSVICTWNFAATFLKKVAWSTFLEIPILKIPVQALRETLEQTDKEFEKVHENMRSDMNNQLHAELPVLAYRPLSIPEPLALTDETVIDATPIDGQMQPPP